MAEMGRYCKAYLASDFKKYDDWSPNLDELRQPEPGKPGDEPEKRAELGDDDILYLQEDLTVTDGIFKDENILFQDESSGWQSFCHDTLEFEVPEDVKAIGAENGSGPQGGGEGEGAAADDA
jgi:hypothetical protein